MNLIRRRTVLLMLMACWLAVAGSAQVKSSATSESVNAAVAQLDAYIRSSLSTTKVPGVAVAVVYNDQVLFLRGYGIRKVGEPAQVDPDTVFEIASLSKPIASTILASLVGQGKIGWDDRIADLDADFQLSNAETNRQITIRDFLSHRSGLATPSGDLLEDLGYSRPSILYQMRYLPLPGTFRKTYAYSNFGYTEGAIAASKKIGKTWETIAAEQLYDRLGMTSTSSRFSDYENRPNKAALHIFVDGQPVNRFRAGSRRGSSRGWRQLQRSRSRRVGAAPVESWQVEWQTDCRRQGARRNACSRRSVVQPQTRLSQTSVPATNFMDSVGTSIRMDRAIRKLRTAERFFSAPPPPSI